MRNPSLAFVILVLLMPSVLGQMLITLPFEEAAPGDVINFTVTIDGVPVEGAEVTVFHFEDTFSTGATNPAGQYDLTVEETGPYFILAHILYEDGNLVSAEEKVLVFEEPSIRVEKQGRLFSVCTQTGIDYFIVEQGEEEVYMDPGEDDCILVAESPYRTEITAPGKGYRNTAEISLEPVGTPPPPPIEEIGDDIPTPDADNQRPPRPAPLVGKGAPPFIPGILLGVGILLLVSGGILFRRRRT